MSEDVTFKGKLYPTNKAPLDLACYLGVDLDEYCGCDRREWIIMEAIDWEFEGKYILINGFVYELQDTEQIHDLSLATLNVDGTIDYVVSFYNGGACLSEAITSTIKRSGIK